MKYVILRNKEYYTDWINSEEEAENQVNEYVQSGEGYRDEYFIREMTEKDLKENYDEDDYFIEDLYC